MSAPQLLYQLTKTGNDIVLNWHVTDLPYTVGTAVFIDGTVPGFAHTSHFLGWWAGGRGLFKGTVTGGWTDFPAGGADQPCYYIPNPSNRFTVIFTTGAHVLTAFAYAVRPPAFTPDGPSGGGPPLHQLSANFIIS